MHAALARCAAGVSFSHPGSMLTTAASRLLGGLAVGAVLLQSPAAPAADDFAAAAQGADAAPMLEQQQPAAAAAMPAAGSRRVFFDVSVDGEVKGRIVVQLYDDVPVGSARFADLARGIQGVGFRRTKFDAVNEDFIRDAGLRRLNFGAEEETPIAGGDGVDLLEAELAAENVHRHTGEGDVSLVVRSDKPLPQKTKLVAYRGKLVEVSETLGEKPNGTAFAVTLHAAPALDATNLVVGKVVDGMTTVKTLSQLPNVKDNTSSGYVQAAKLIGDRRADVAIRSFGRPFNKIVVAESGTLE